jgi:ElaB/YqjD/DUF883 family membrane-anchored ribosome-binding protein
MSKKDLTKDQIKDIIHMKAEGHSIAEIMQKYPFIKTRSTIYYHLYKAPAEKQNSLTLLHKKLDQVLQKLQNIEQYLSLQTMIPEPAEKVQNKVQDTKQNIVQYTKSPINKAEAYITASEITKRIYFEANGKTPDKSGITFYLKNNGAKIKDRILGYLLEDVIHCLQERNKNISAGLSKGSIWNISELEKLLKDS